MNNKTPARLHKKEPLTLEYNRTETLVAGMLIIMILIIIAFVFGSENISYIFWKCI